MNEYSIDLRNEEMVQAFKALTREPQYTIIANLKRNDTSTTTNLTKDNNQWTIEQKQDKIIIFPCDNVYVAQAKVTVDAISYYAATFTYDGPLNIPGYGGDSDENLERNDVEHPFEFTFPSGNVFDLATEKEVALNIPKASDFILTIDYNLNA